MTKLLEPLLIITFMGTTAIAKDCRLTPAIARQSAALSFSTFDQTEGKGHRALAAKGCYLSAAVLIDVYTLQHKQTLKDWQQRVLNFHSGQMYAFDQLLYPLAIGRFKEAFNPDQSLAPQLAWNEYVHATVAFLERDMDKLLKYKDKIVKLNPNDGNLQRVNSFVKCFEFTYKEAYSLNCTGG